MHGCVFVKKNGKEEYDDRTRSSKDGRDAAAAGRKIGEEKLKRRRNKEQSGERKVTSTTAASGFILVNPARSLEKFVRGG